MIRGI